MYRSLLFPDIVEVILILIAMVWIYFFEFCFGNCSIVHSNLIVAYVSSITANFLWNWVEETMGKFSLIRLYIFLFQESLKRWRRRWWQGSQHTLDKNFEFTSFLHSRFSKQFLWISRRVAPKQSGEKTQRLWRIVEFKFNKYKFSKSSTKVDEILHVINAIN